MKYTHEQQRLALERAAKSLNLGTHISELESRKDCTTWADRILSSHFRKDMPVKKSFLMCNSLDIDFFFSKDGIALYTYAGYADNRDAKEDKIVQAFRLANQMRDAMQVEIEKIVELSFKTEDSMEEMDLE